MHDEWRAKRVIVRARACLWNMITAVCREQKQHPPLKADLQAAQQVSALQRTAELHIQAVGALAGVVALHARLDFKVLDGVDGAEHLRHERNAAGTKNGVARVAPCEGLTHADDLGRSVRRKKRCMSKCVQVTSCERCHVRRER
jgi:hypothetical protein